MLFSLTAYRAMSSRKVSRTTNFFILHHHSVVAMTHLHGLSRIGTLFNGPAAPSVLLLIALQI